MQKKLLTVAVASALAVPLAAFADVTVYGTIDGGLRTSNKLDDGTGATDSKFEQLGSYRTTNRWGLKGSEDLGGGLMANFALEGFYTSSDNTDTLDGFNRKSYVGLSKGGSEVHVGRDYTANFKSQGIYDPMSYTFTGVTPAAGTNTAGVRDNNLITAGFRFGSGGIRVEYGLGEAVGAGASGDRLGFMADFAFGPVTVTGAYSSEETGVSVDTKTTNLGGKYGMGALTFRFGISSTEVDTPGAKAETDLLLLGVQYKMSPTLSGRVGYYDRGTKTAGADTGSAKTFIVALDYSLSKSTTAYVEVDRVTLDTLADAAATGSAGARRDGSTGMGVGIVHAF
jgi:predicted porin